MILLEYQNIKVFLQKITLQIDLKKILRLKELNLLSWHVVNDLNGEEIIRIFYETKLQKTNHKELGNEKAIKRKGDKLYVKSNGCKNSFNSWIDKKNIV